MKSLWLNTTVMSQRTFRWFKRGTESAKARNKWKRKMWHCSFKLTFSVVPVITCNPSYVDLIYMPWETEKWRWRKLEMLLYLFIISWLLFTHQTLIWQDICEMDDLQVGRLRHQWIRRQRDDVLADSWESLTLAGEADINSGNNDSWVANVTVMVAEGISYVNLTSQMCFKGLLFNQQTTNVAHLFFSLSLANSVENYT